MITLEIVACGKVQVTKQIPRDDLRLMGTLRALREQKLALKRSRGRPLKLPQTNVKFQIRPSENSDEEDDDDLSASKHSETENEESDESDDKFLKNLERKKDQIDLEKMTRRQRMAYQAANATESAAENNDF